MTKIPGIYVAINGDFTALKADMKQARQFVTEQSHGMSNALNNALSPGQIQTNVKGLIESLNTLANSSKNTGASFKYIGADLGELRKVTGMTEEQFSKLQSRMLQTKAASAQENALRRIARQANLTEKETRQMGKQFGLSSSQIDRVTRSTNKASTSMSSFGRVAKTALAFLSVSSALYAAKSVVGIADAYSLVSSKLQLVTKGTEEFNKVYAELFKISQDTGSSFESNASNYSNLALALKDTAISGDEILSMFATLNKSLVVAGAGTQEASSFMLQFKQALGSGRLAGQELNAVLESNSYFAGLLAKNITNSNGTIGISIGQLKKYGEEGKLTTDVIMKAFPAMSAQIDSDFGRITKTIARATVELSNAFNDVIADTNKAAGMTDGIATSISKLARTITENKAVISDAFTGLISGATATIEGVSNVIRSIQALRIVLHSESGSVSDWLMATPEDTKRMLSEFKDGTTQMKDLLAVVREEIKDTQNSWGLWSDKKANLEELRDQEKQLVDAINKRAEAYKNANKSAPSVSVGSKSGGATPPVLPPPSNTDAQQEAQLRLASRLRGKLAEVERSYNTLALVENKNAREIDLQNAENNYEEKIISLSRYIKKKQDIEVSAAREAVSISQGEVAEYSKVLEGQFASGTKGEIDKANARIKLNQATVDLRNSEADLAIIVSRNSAESKRYRREEIDYIKEYQIKYAEQAGSFSKAEQIRQTTIEYTTELWRLQQDVIDGVAGSQEALSSYQARGVKDLKIAGTQEQYGKDDTFKSAFGSDSGNQFSGIVGEYEDMYRQIRDIEDEHGKNSIEAKRAWFGAEVDMARDSVDTITKLLMSGNKDQFIAGKALAISMATVNAALAVSKALTLGYPMNFVVAGLVGAAAGVEIATIAGQQYEGRAMGGPVNAGQTYIVNENRLKEGPEYFTPKVAGTITPAPKMNGGGGGKSITVNQNISVQGQVNRRTASQMANSAAREQRVASARFG